MLVLCVPFQPGKKSKAIFIQFQIQVKIGKILFQFFYISKVQLQNRTYML